MTAFRRVLAATFLPRQLRVCLPLPARRVSRRRWFSWRVPWWFSQTRVSGIGFSSRIWFSFRIRDSLRCRWLWLSVLRLPFPLALSVSLPLSIRAVLTASTGRCERIALSRSDGRRHRPIELQLRSSVGPGVGSWWLPSLIDTPATKAERQPKMSADALVDRALRDIGNGRDEILPGKVGLLPILMRLLPSYMARRVAET
jgi:hypothetical protein